VNPRQQGFHTKKVYKPSKGHEIVMLPMSIHNEKNELLWIQLTAGVTDHDYNLFNAASGDTIPKNRARTLGEEYYWKHYPRYFNDSGNFEEHLKLTTGDNHNVRLFYEIPDNSNLEHWFLQIKYTLDASKTDGPSSVEKTMYVPLD
jgi:hypothetical protein